MPAVQKLTGQLENSEFMVIADALNCRKKRHGPLWQGMQITSFVRRIIGRL